MSGLNGPSYPELNGKVAVVTGAARGMGARFAEGLAARGVAVIAGDINVEAMEATATAIESSTGARVISCRLNVTNPEDHTRLAERAVEQFGRLDYWVNNAGVFPQAPVLDITAEQLHSTFSVNVDGVLFGAQAAARAIGTDGGSVVNMASLAAFRVRPTRGAYGTSKAAVTHLTKFLARELGSTGIRFNAIAPGFVETEMTQWLHEDPAALAAALDTVPLGRMGTTDDILNALIFLLSDSSSYITGTTLTVDGGSSTHS
jgi:3-oxoacyl-[acyl-carrier protein] reductase